MNKHFLSTDGVNFVDNELVEIIGFYIQNIESIYYELDEALIFIKEEEDKIETKLQHLFENLYANKFIPSIFIDIINLKTYKKIDDLHEKIINLKLVKSIVNLKSVDGKIYTNEIGDYHLNKLNINYKTEEKYVIQLLLHKTPKGYSYKLQDFLNNMKTKFVFNTKEEKDEFISKYLSNIIRVE